MTVCKIFLFGSVEKISNIFHSFFLNSFNKSSDQFLPSKKNCNTSNTDNFVQVTWFIESWRSITKIIKSGWQSNLMNKKHLITFCVVIYTKIVQIPLNKCTRVITVIRKLQKTRMKNMNKKLSVIRKLKLSFLKVMKLHTVSHKSRKISFSEKKGGNTCNARISPK